jgi:hypothetical protein
LLEAKNISGFLALLKRWPTASVDFLVPEPPFVFPSCTQVKIRG